MTSLDGSVWRLFLPSRAPEQDPAFRSVLTSVLHTGVRQCGAIGLVGTLLYVGLSVLGLGYELHWTYQAFRSAGRESQVVLVGVLIVAALSVFALALAQTECSLRTGRLFGLGAVLLTTAVAAFEGALRGTFNTEFVVSAYLLVVAIIPFYPPQVLGVGGMAGAVVYLLGHGGLVWGGPAVPSAPMAKHLVFVGGASLLITGMSAALYLRHWAFGQAQADLRKNRDLLRRTQRAGQIGQVGGWEHLPGSGRVRGTEQLWRLLGTAPETDLSLEAWLDFYPPESRQKVRAALERALEAGAPFDLEVPFTPTDGKRRWGRLRGKTHRQNGRTVRLTGTLQDITELKARERELQQERDRLATLFESLPTPVVRCTVEKEGPLITDANEAFKKVFGLEDTAAEGKNIDALLVPEERQEEAAEINRRALEEETLRTEVHRETAAGLRDFRLQVAGREQKEGPSEIYAIFSDVTERKRREQALRDRQEKVESLYAATDRLLRAKSPEAGAKRILEVLQDVFDYPVCGVGFEGGEVIVPEESGVEEGYHAPVPEPLGRETKTATDRAYRRGETVVVEDLRALGNEIDYGDLRSAAGVPIGERGVIFIGQGQKGGFDSFDLHLIEVLASYAALVLDRIEREQKLLEAKEEAEDAARLKSAMLANTSHEIRTPLTSITGFAEMLTEELEGKLGDFAERIYRSGRRLMKTLDSMLQLSKLEAGAFDLEREPTALGEVAQKTAELLRPEAEKKSIGLHLEAKEPVVGQWNEGALNRIAENLLENAIKFTPEGGRVDVRVQRNGEEVVLEVEDTGVGISEEALPEVFEAFKQESEGLGREYEGSGLGLSITKKLTELLDGSIEVETEKGKGTCFTVRLPLRTTGEAG